MSSTSKETNPSRGLFVVIEGLDRSGKSTQVNLLVDYFNKNYINFNSFQIHFPNRETESGKKLDQYLRKILDLKDEDALKLFSDNRWEQSENIIQEVEKNNKIIICSRYAYSGVAYAKLSEYRPLEECMVPDRGLPRPDIVIFIDVDPEEASKRDGYGDEKFEDIIKQKKVRENFSKLFENDQTVVTISESQIRSSILNSNSLSSEQITSSVINSVHKKIIEEVEKKWFQVNGPLGRLWTKDD